MIKYLLIVVSLLIASVSVFGQDGLERDLRKSLKNYELVNLDNASISEKAKSKQPIRLQAYGREFEFVLTPHDLRAARYTAVETSENGERKLERGEVTTFRAALKYDPDSEVRLSTTASGVEGLIYTSDNKKFFVVQATKFSSLAAKDAAVVFAEEDLTQNIDLSEDAMPLPADFYEPPASTFDVLKSYLFGSSKSVQTDVSSAAPESVAASPMALQVVEVATEADYQWVTTAGSAANANSEILGILNLVDGIYRRDLNLSVTVTYQHAWTSADPYQPTSQSTAMNDILNSFTSYWTANFPYSSYPRDTAHLFTGKVTGAGLAWIGVVCKSPSYAYGLSGRSNSGVQHIITAHEIGHNLSAQHVDNSGSCTNSVMNPVVSSSVTGFCDVSKTQIANYVAASGTCLSTSTGGTPTPTPTVTPTPTPTPTTYSISGYVTYGSTPAGQATQFVPRVTLSVTGSATTSASTNLSGAYTISGLPANGTYTVTPSKTGDINGAITSFDSTLVLRYVASGSGGLTANQLTAADADNNGAITAFDATLILRYVSTGAQTSSTGSVGNWKFVPSQRNYSPLSSSLANQNYQAILLGDVNGSWTQPSSFAGTDETNPSFNKSRALLQAYLPLIFRWQ